MSELLGTGVVKFQDPERVGDRPEGRKQMTIRHIHTKPQTVICNSELCTSRGNSLNYAQLVDRVALNTCAEYSTRHEFGNDVQSIDS